MKNKVLTTAGVLVLGATSIGLIDVTMVHDAATATRMGLSAGILGLGSMGLFFVGLAFKQ